MDRLTPWTVTGVGDDDGGSGDSCVGSQLVGYDFGAHLAEWTLDGVPVVWCSPQARLDGSAAIRGGVPLCFPWFGGGPSGDLSPSHGPVRTATWRRDDPTGPEVMAWRLSSSDLADAPGAEHLPGPFELRHSVALHQDGTGPALRVSLEVTCAAGEAITVEAALHTYLGVADARTARVHGLEDCAYLDKVTGRREHQVGPVRFDGETDRVYDRSGPVRLEDGAGRRSVLLQPSGATQTVVWNPGPAKAAAMADLGDDDWTRFVCVETAATADRALVVPPGTTSTVSCVITPSSAASRVTR